MKLKQASARLSFAFQVLLGRLQHNRYNTKNRHVRISTSQMTFVVRYIQFNSSKKRNRDGPFSIVSVVIVKSTVFEIT